MAGTIRFGLFAALIVGGWRSAAQHPPRDIPNELKTPAGEELVLHALASGDQIYTCNGSAWTLSGPDAKLSDEAGHEAGSHFAGPAWRWSDGSQVTGKPVASAAPDPHSIPWLRLTATGHQGDGVMKNVSSIQRLNLPAAFWPCCLPSLIALTVVRSDTESCSAALDLARCLAAL